MNKVSRLTLLLVPVTIFLAVLFFLWRGLSINPELLPSTLVDKAVPAFHLTNLLSPAHPFTEQNLKGKVSLLNVWASWCSSCEMEHSMLVEIENKYHIPIYGILYKDEVRPAKAFLAQNGNPYKMLGNDNKGEVAMDLGVYGTPETFIVNKEGIIVHRHVGVISQEVWETELLPIIKSQESSQASN